VTLIELLVVVTIIAMFGALVLPRLWKKVSGAKQTVAREQINGFITALGMYKLDTGRFPSTEQGLQALRVRPQDEARWDGPYLPQDVPPDPWGHVYIYKFPGEHGEEPDIISYGADGREGGDGENGDIVSWKH
jgi:general secretion pathway protein G